MPQGVAVVEVSPSELIVVGGSKLVRVDLTACYHETRDARCRHRFVRHLGISSPDDRVDLVTDPRLGSIAPRAARLPEVADPTAILSPTHMLGLIGWLDGGRRLIGQSLDELARLSCVASVAFAISIGERAADLATQMTWERGSPMRSSPVTDSRRLLEPFEAHAHSSERANLALMAALSRIG